MQALGLTPIEITVETALASGRQMNPSLSPTTMKNYVDKILQNPGQTALIAGHSNTTPAIIAKLGGDVAVTIPETEFDNLYVVTIYAKGKAKVAQLKY